MEQDSSGSPRGIGAQVGLLLAVFAASFVLLLGGAALVGQLGATGAPAATGPGASGALPSAPAGSTSSPSGGQASAGPSALPSPTALTGPTGDPILIGAGDIADCASDGDEATAALLDGLPGTIFTAGDNVYPSGTAESFAACYQPSWGRHLARTRPAPGNHDWDPGSLNGYSATFGAAAAGPGGASWYAYDLGSWHIVVLDSSCERVGGCGPDSPQGTWLAADLAASRARCTLAVFHHPRLSSGDRHGSDPSVDPLWRALYAAGADVIVNGHDHDYERFAPQDPEGNEDRIDGIRQFVIGTGGTALRGFDDPVANSELRASVAHGLLELTLRERGYDWRFIPTAGDFSDRGTASCH
ncbi:MAG: metallophosphoesterase [Chloroflexi bacterium]|nr:metallophosphoesterase [Chloroflexota bacterium]